MLTFGHSLIFSPSASCLGVEACFGLSFFCSSCFSWRCIGMHISVCISLYLGQLTLCHSMSQIHARQHFLTNYFDPFYADLHLYPTKPDAVYDANVFSFHRNSKSYLAQKVEQLRISGPLASVWAGLVETIISLQRRAWETWGVNTQQQQIRAVGGWPPA